MVRVKGDIFKMDFTDLAMVKALADQLGPGQVVYKHPNRPNYNITHAERLDRYEVEWVVHRTSNIGS